MTITIVLGRSIVVTAGSFESRRIGRNKETRDLTHEYSANYSKSDYHKKLNVENHILYTVAI